MRRTHKKILGFAGLGLVAATTTAAAMLPIQGVSAVAGGTTDTIQVTVISGNPDMSVSSPSGSEITTPEYKFTITYNRLTKAKATLVNYDADGNIKFTKEIWNEDLDYRYPGSKTFNLNLNDYGGEGYFVITVQGTGDDGVEVEQILSVAYDTENKESEADPDSGNAIVETPIPQEETAKVIVHVYDKDKKEVKTIEITDPKDVENIDLSDLPDGDYDIKIDHYNKYGDLIDSTTIIATKTGDHYIINIPIHTKVDSVSIIEINIYDEKGNIVRVLKIDRNTGVMSVYDANGKLLFTIDNAYVNGKLIIPLEGLPYGNYTTVIMFKNKYGRLVGGTVNVAIKYFGKAIVVPDTGDFFHGLNISREDYLITGLIVFMIIGIVAFGIVKRNHGTSKKAKINGKNRH